MSVISCCCQQNAMCITAAVLATRTSEWMNDERRTRLSCWSVNKRDVFYRQCLNCADSLLTDQQVAVVVVMVTRRGQNTMSYRSFHRAQTWLGSDRARERTRLESGKQRNWQWFFLFYLFPSFLLNLKFFTFWVKFIFIYCRCPLLMMIIIICMWVLFTS